MCRQRGLYVESLTSLNMSDAPTLTFGPIPVAKTIWSPSEKSLKNALSQTHFACDKEGATTLIYQYIAL